MVSNLHGKLKEIGVKFQMNRRTDGNGGHRELIIGLASRGYVALYRYVAQLDAVFVLAIRNQREDGYKRDQ